MPKADDPSVDLEQPQLESLVHLCRMDDEVPAAIHPLTPGQWRIGRDPAQCDIVVPAVFLAVARGPHAILTFGDVGVVQIQGVHKNGTFINDERLPDGKARSLRLGDVITLAGRRRDGPARCTYVLNDRTPELTYPTTTDEFVSENATILALMANPSQTAPLKLDEELRGIDLAISGAKFRDQLDLRQLGAVRISDLQWAIMRYAPAIVHFSGHGSSAGAIIMQDDLGNSAAVPQLALSNLFRILSPPVRCVVLNACYSQKQGEAIAQHVPCVVGMSRAISDSAAIQFSAAFYRGLAYGYSVQRAFDLGCSSIELNQDSRKIDMHEEAIPSILSKWGIADRLHFTSEERVRGRM